MFDLDGTITRHDTLLPFVLGFLWRRPWRLPGLLVLPLAVGLLALRRGARAALDRGQLKSLLIRCTLRGVERARIEAWTSRFVPTLLARGLHADALAEIAAQRRNGARLILLSASTDLYVPAIARALGFDEVICTGVRWNGERLDGHLSTPNRRAQEKARCFESLRDGNPGLRMAAYGNAASDLAHLCLADWGVLVNGSGRARRAAALLGIACARWH